MAAVPQASRQRATKLREARLPPTCPLTHASPRELALPVPQMSLWRTARLCAASRLAVSQVR